MADIKGLGLEGGKFSAIGSGDRLDLTAADGIKLKNNGVITDGAGNTAITVASGGNVTLAGNLTVSGTTTTVNSTTVSIADPIFEIGDASSDDNLDRGIKMKYNNDGAKIAFMGYDDSEGKFVFIPNATDTSSVFSGTAGILVADLNGNADSATALATGRTLQVSLGSTSASAAFDGSGNISDIGVSGTLAITNGGTGSTTAAAARTALGLAIGTDVQAYDVDLAALAGVTSSADALPYFTGSGTASVTTMTAFARSILDDADEATFKATVNLEIGTDVQAYDAGLADIAGLAVTDGNIIVGNGSNWVAESGSTARTSLGLAIGTDVQAYDADLDTLSGMQTGAATALAALTSSEVAIIDGGTAATATTLADADKVVVNDAGTMVQVALTDFNTYFESSLTQVNNVTSASSLATVGTITSGTWEGGVIADAYVTDALTISGGTVDNTPIGQTTAAAGAFTVLEVAASGSFALGDGVFTSVDTGITAGASISQGAFVIVNSSGLSSPTSNANAAGNMLVGMQAETGTDVKLVSSGQVVGFDTSGFSVGAQLFLGADGNATATAPTSGEIIQVGYALNSAAYGSGGRIFFSIRHIMSN